jgi:hypothetical protein
MTEGVNLLKIEFFDAMARLEAGLEQFSNRFDPEFARDPRSVCLGLLTDGF